MSIRHSYVKGETIFYEGSTSDSAYIIECGKVEISTSDSQGGKRVLGVLEEDDIFGEMGLIDNLPRSATAKALEDTTISIITKERFETLSKLEPELLKPLLKVLSQRLRETLDMLQEGYKLPGKDRRKSRAPKEQEPSQV